MLLKHFNLDTIWLPILQYWLNQCIPKTITLYLAIDRTHWGNVNLLYVSLIWKRRAIPLYWMSLSHRGSSNLSAQASVLTPLIPLLSDYHFVVLGDREFCSTKLASWLRSNHFSFCLRLKKSTFVALSQKDQRQLAQLGLKPGMKFMFTEIQVTKSKTDEKFNVVGKWKKNYCGFGAKEGWFLLTDLPTIEEAVKSYAKRFDMEEMFRDFKSGGYNLEEIALSGDRFNAMLLLLALSYSEISFCGETLVAQGVQAYVARPREKGRSQRRHSLFYVGAAAARWVHAIADLPSEAVELMSLCPQKRLYYLRGLRARTLILQSA